jgi:hypothetical protein
VRKIGRESNGAAHTLASLARSYDQNNLWLGYVSLEIENVVAEESVNFVDNDE